MTAILWNLLHPHNTLTSKSEAKSSHDREITLYWKRTFTNHLIYQYNVWSYANIYIYIAFARTSITLYKCYQHRDQPFESSAGRKYIASTRAALQPYQDLQKFSGSHNTFPPKNSRGHEFLQKLPRLTAKTPQVYSQNPAQHILKSERVCISLQTPYFFYMPLPFIHSVSATLFLGIFIYAYA